MKTFTSLSTALLLTAIWLPRTTYTFSVDGPVQPAASIMDGTLPKGPAAVREVTAYNPGDENQTDDSPCIGAANKNICELVSRGISVCAANFVPLNTRLYLPEMNIDCIVLDRTSPKYGERVDMAFLDYQEAVAWGKKMLIVHQ